MGCSQHDSNRAAIREHRSDRQFGRSTRQLCNHGPKVDAFGLLTGRAVSLRTGASTGEAAAKGANARYKHPIGCRRALAVRTRGKPQSRRGHPSDSASSSTRPLRPLQSSISTRLATLLIHQTRLALPIHRIDTACPPGRTHSLCSKSI